MIKMLANLSRYIADLLETASGEPTSTDSGSNTEQGSDDQQGNAGLDNANGQATGDEAPVSAWQSIRDTQRAHWRWLRERPPLIISLMVLVIALVAAENWLIAAWDWLTLRLGQLFSFIGSHRLASTIIVTALFYLIFGLKWLPGLAGRISGGIRKRKLLSTVMAGVGLVIFLWLVTNSGTWVVLPFEEGFIETQEINGDKASKQLISELSLIRAGGAGLTLTLLEPQYPIPRAEPITLNKLESACDQLLVGPTFFDPSISIPLGPPSEITHSLPGDSRELPTGTGSTQGKRVDLGEISIGAFNIPSQLLLRAILRVAPTNYREFNGQIFEHSGNFTISISASDPVGAWEVTGPVDALAEMIEYLALRIALSTDPEVFRDIGLERDLDNWELAFQLGNRAFNNGNYVRARAFYEIASKFSQPDTSVLVMLGFAHYQATLEQSSDYGYVRALKAMKTAADRDPETTLLSLYQKCLSLKNGSTEPDIVLVAFNEFQPQEASLMLASLEAEELDKLQLRGPGRNLVVDENFLLFVDENGSLAGGPIDSPRLLVMLNQGRFPRKIAILQDTNLLYLTTGGKVTLFVLNTKEFYPLSTSHVGSIQQFAEYKTQEGESGLMFLNHLGQIFLCKPDEENESMQGCRPGEAPIFSAPLAARQIFPVRDQLYFVGTDGDVWVAEIADDEVAHEPRQLTSGANAQEIFVTKDETIFLLHDNGNISQKDGRSVSEGLTLIDRGTGTSQIFATANYLYVLKSDGALWRISNPRNPDPESDFSRLELSSLNQSVEMSFTEIYVTEQSSEEEESSSRNIYLYTNNNILFKGVDSGDQRVTLRQLYAAPIKEVASS